jgi:hypothetical protein
MDASSPLPEDPGGLRALVRELSIERDRAFEALKLKSLEVEKLKLQLARLRRLQFGQSSEKLAREAAQLELTIEEIEADEGKAAAPKPIRRRRPSRERASRASPPGKSCPPICRARRSCMRRRPSARIAAARPASARTAARCSIMCPATSG